MNFENLNTDARKRFCKLFTLDDFKKVCHSQKALNTTVLSALKKGPDRVQKKELDEYLTAHSADEKDKLVMMLYVLAEKKIKSYYKNYDELKTHLEEISYDDIDDTDLSEFKDAYQESGAPFPFEDLVVFLTQPGKKQMIESDLEQTKKENIKLKDDLKTIKAQNDKLQSDLLSKTTDFKQANADHKSEVAKLKKEISQYKAVLSADHSQKKLSELLKIDLSGKSYSQVFELLNEQEAACIKDNAFEKAKLILAAKYALIMSLEENTNV